MFARRLPLASLIELCRALRHSLGAGLALPETFALQGKRGPAPARAVALAISQDLERGESLEDALQGQAHAFPPLFLALARAGEQTGSLPEIFRELERYFSLQLKLRRQFLWQISWPLFELFAAIVVIAGLIWVLGMIGSISRTKPLDPLGVGLTGTRGALTFLALVIGTTVCLASLFLLLRHMLRGSGSVDAWLLRLPALGPCLRALSMGRFCLVLRLTLEAGMPIARALGMSLEATGNAAFAAVIPAVKKQIRAGDDLTATLASTGLFAEEFRNILAVAEETGTVPEAMARQAEHFEEETSRRMTVLTRVAGGLVWALVALLIAATIIRLFITLYLEPINKLL